MEAWLHNFTYNWGLGNFFSPFWRELPILGGMVVLICAELYFSGWERSTLRALSRLKKTGLWDILSFIFYTTGVRRVLSNIMFLGFIGYFYNNFYNDGQLLYTISLTHGWPLWLKFIAVTFVYDFLFYWSHRLKHTSSWLWNLHEFHHSSTEVGLFTTYRGHPMDSLFHLLTISVPIQFFFDLSLVNSLLFLLVSSLSGLMNHARIDSSFGLLGKYIFVSPRMHHAHHSKTNLNSNFGEIFVFWDKIFGTYKEPDISIYNLSYGIHNNFYETDSPIVAYLKPVQRFYGFLLFGLGKHNR